MHKQKKIALFLFLLGTVTSIYSKNKRAQAHFHLAEVMNSEGDIQGAITQYKKTLEFEQSHADALFQLGCLLYQLGNVDGAIQTLEKRKALAPLCTQTELGLARCWMKKNNPDNAIRHYRRAIELKPKDEVAQCELATLLVRQGKFEAATTTYRRILQLNPRREDILVTLAETLAHMQHNREALACYDQLILSHANDPQLLMRKARILTLLGRIDEGLELYTCALRLVPDNPKILYNIAHTHRLLGDTAKATPLYRRILSLEPDNERARLGLARTLLYEGKDQEGWHLLDTINRHGYRSSEYLDSVDDISGKTILIGGDWLHENMIQFMRYARNLKELGAHVVIQTPQALASILSRCPHIDDLIIMGRDQSYPHHYYIPITSLPNLMGTDESTITTNGPYLYADPKLVQQWHEKLSSGNQLNVGVYVRSQEDILCTELIQLDKLDGIQLYLLHNRDAAVNISDVCDRAVVHIICNAYKENNETFPHLAAIVQNLDLVITQDATLAHLAGALHVPVWILLPRVADWRWQAQREDSPWYPTMRLFRQEKDGVWTNVMHNIRKELEKILSA